MENRFILAIFTFFIVSSTSVMANIVVRGTGPLSRIFDPILALFDGMPEGAYPRFMLFLLVFAVFLLLTRYAPMPPALGDARDDKKGRFLLGFIAAILAFISVIAIPDQYINFLYYEFSFFVAFILTLVPIAAILFVYTRAVRGIENVWAKRIILTIVFLIIFSLLTGAAAQARSTSLNDQSIYGFTFVDIMEFLASISVILFIIALIAAGGAGAAAGYVAGLASKPLTGPSGRAPMTPSEARETEAVDVEAEHDDAALKEEDEKATAVVTKEQSVLKELLGTEKSLSGNLHLLRPFVTKLLIATDVDVTSKVTVKAPPTERDAFKNEVLSIRKHIPAALRKAEEQLKNAFGRLDRLETFEHRLLVQDTDIIKRYEAHVQRLVEHLAEKDRAAVKEDLLKRIKALHGHVMSAYSSSHKLFQEAETKHVAYLMQFDKVTSLLDRSTLLFLETYRPGLPRDQIRTFHHQAHEAAKVLFQELKTAQTHMDDLLEITKRISAFKKDERVVFLRLVHEEGGDEKKLKMLRERLHLIETKMRVGRS